MASVSPPAWTALPGSGPRKLEELVFDNQALKQLPLDPEAENFVRQVSGACFSRVQPTPVERPVLVSASPSALGLLGLNAVEEYVKPAFVRAFSGNLVLDGAEPAAHCYCGHQFGHFSGQLGDGATMYLGEVINPDGERWELQYKGAGKTPYSRTADGRKVLRSSLREFLCSEAMHALGVPTTRAATICTSSSTVARDMFYTGDVKREPCSVITRIAPSFLRFGSFEVVRGVDGVTGRSGPSPGNLPLLHSLLDYTTSMFFPDIHARFPDREDRCLGLFQEVIRRTATLVAKWQAVGFCHGVLNTDNMSVLGLTIDYGPFGFMDRFDPDFVCNSSDDGGRYSYRRQPEMCRWNCETLGSTLSLAMPSKDWRACVAEFDTVYEAQYQANMLAKLGLADSETPDEDMALVESLLSTMQKTGADFTNTFRLLALVDPTAPDTCGVVVEQLCSQLATVEEIASSFKPSVPEDQLGMLLMLAQRDPRMAAQMGPIMAEMEKHRKYKEMKSVDQTAKAEADTKLWTEWVEQYSARLGKLVPPGADAAAAKEWVTRRRAAMNAVNPKYVLRNYVAQKAIDAATKGDYGPVHELQVLLSLPFQGVVSETTSRADAVDAAGAGAAPPSTTCGATLDLAAALVDARPPSWASELKVS